MISMLAMLCFACAQTPLTEGPVELVADGFQFTEGPLWLPSGELIFSDLQADTIYRIDKSVVRRPSGKSNGLALDPQGRLVACEGANGRVTRTEKDGSITVLADRYEGKRFNSPNDVVVRADGVVFFTDPPYNLEGRAAELPYAGVFCISPEGAITLVAKDFDRPNGVALAPDGKTLYVTDTAAGHIRAFQLDSQGKATNGRVLCEVSGPDGLKVDAQGRLWSTSAAGIQILSPEGKPLELIKIPQVPANCAFDGKDPKTLYITARTAVYKVRCKRP